MASEYYLIITTDSYSGNFERQLCSYVFGVVDEHCPSALDWTPNEEDRQDAELNDYYEFWEEAIDRVPTEYGYMPYEMWPDERGNYTAIRLKLDKWAWEELSRSPKYEKKLMERLDEVTSRLTFSSVRDEEGSPLPIKLKSIRWEEHQITVKLHSHEILMKNFLLPR